jgi:hypothetical protein
MAASESIQNVASCLFRPSIATPAPNTFQNVGIKNITRITGVPAGGWLVELDNKLPFQRLNVKVTPYGILPFTYAVKDEAGGTYNLEIRTFNGAGALADVDFWLSVDQAAAALREDQRFS